MKIKLKKWCLLLGISPIPALVPIFGTISCGSNQFAGNPVLYDDLPKNYSISQYHTAIENYRKKVLEMNNEQMVIEASSIKQALRELNDTVYNGLDPFLTKEMLEKLLNEEESDLPSFSKEKVQNIYNFFAAQTSDQFFPSFLKFCKNSKNSDFISKNEWNFWEASYMMVCFVGFKTEYPVHRLLILANQFLSKNLDPTKWTGSNEKNTIGNLICELDFWWSDGRNARFFNFEEWLKIFDDKELQEDEKKTWEPLQFPNKDFFLQDYESYNNSYQKMFGKNGKYSVQNNAFFQRSGNKFDRYFLNENFFIIPFLLSESDPKINAK